MIDFNDIWQLLLENGASHRKEEGTRRYWDTLSDEEQHCAFNNISRKLAERAFVHYDPIRAIKENIRQAKELQPEFLKGDEGGDLVQVRYQGFYKICTRATMELFGLEWVRDW
jgi:hypothetical protein